MSVGCGGSDYHLRIWQEERSANIRRNALGQCELTFHAYYSDFDYLFGEQEEADES